MILFFDSFFHTEKKRKKKKTTRATRFISQIEHEYVAAPIGRTDTVHGLCISLSHHMFVFCRNVEVDLCLLKIGGRKRIEGGEGTNQVP